MIPEHIAREVDLLRQDGLQVDASEIPGWWCVVIHALRLPNGYSKAATEVLLKLPRAYPNGKPDMFWTDEDLKLASGEVPRRADVVECLLGKQWRRFSWHPGNWRPGNDDLRTFVSFVRARLARVE